MAYKICFLVEKPHNTRSKDEIVRDVLIFFIVGYPISRLVFSSLEWKIKNRAQPQFLFFPELSPQKKKPLCHRRSNFAPYSNT